MRRTATDARAAILLLVWMVAPAGHTADDDNPLVWLASEGFSSMQNVNDWWYQYEEGSGTPRNLTWDPAGYFEAPGVASALRITATEQTPASRHPIVRTWRAPYTGTIRVDGSATSAAGTCPDGLAVSIRKWGSVEWERRLRPGASATHDATIEVTQGDVIGFRVDPGVQSGCPATRWDPRITYLRGPTCWRLVWHDEFNNPGSSAPDPARWRVWDADEAPCPDCSDLGVTDDVQRDWLTDTWLRASNIVVSDGVVTIHTAHDGQDRQEFSGGMMDTRGRFEPNGGLGPAVRLEAKTLRSAGEPVHSAFWTVGGTDAINAYKWDPTKLDTPAAQGRDETVGSREFSAIQGNGNWYYEYVDADGAYLPLDYNARARRWENRAAGRYLRVARNHQIPDEGHAVARSWRAPHAGRVRITFARSELFREDCGDGVQISIRVGPARVTDPAEERIVWSRTLRRGGRVGLTTRLVSVRKGERIRFRVDPLRDGCDRMTWDPAIEYNHWPARGEIDVMEYSTMDRPSVGPHTPAFNHALGNSVRRRLDPRSIDPSGWLVSWVDWYPNRLEFFFVESRAGKAAAAAPLLVYDRHDGPDEWPFNHGHYLILQDKIKPKNADGTDRALPDFPTAFRVDYVRVWENTCGKWSYNDGGTTTARGAK